MRSIKRIMAVLMGVVMALTLCIPAFADESDAGNSGTTTTYTITAPDTDHKYEIYQIFTGDLDAAKGILSNIKWGKNGINDGTAVKEGDAVPENILTELAGVSGGTDAAKLAVITKYASLTNPIATVTKNNTYNAVPGYYLIKDKDNTVTGNDVYTTYIVKVVGDVNIQTKSDVPSFEKKIKDTNDTDGVTSDWQDSADYDIGDQVPFKLEGTVAANYDDYKTYYFAFHDKEETGLTFNVNSVKVYVDGKLITDGYDVKTGDNVSETEEKCTFEVVFSNLKEIKGDDGKALVHAGSKIRVEYTSELNDDAVLGNEGNVNKAKLEFSNNPNNEQAGKPDKPGETPWDNVIVFTYKVVVNKVDENNQALPGAEFTLIKKVAQLDAEGKVEKDENGNTLYKEETIDVVKTNGGTTFTFKGLDDGDYILRETKTPTDYNTIADIEFTVKADHTIEWNGVNRDNVLTNLNGVKADGTVVITGTPSTGTLETTVMNKKGAELPSTGGIGTTIFYVVGGLLMVAAAVMFVTKKRVESDK